MSGIKGYKLLKSHFLLIFDATSKLGSAEWDKISEGETVKWPTLGNMYYLLFDLAHTEY